METLLCLSLPLKTPIQSLSIGTWVGKHSDPLPSPPKLSRSRSWSGSHRCRRSFKQVPRPGEEAISAWRRWTIFFLLPRSPWCFAKMATRMAPPTCGPRARLPRVPATVGCRSKTSCWMGPHLGPPLFSLRWPLLSSGDFMSYFCVFLHLVFASCRGNSTCRARGRMS